MSPSGQGTVKTVIDWLVILLLLFLMVRTYRRRKTAEVASSTPAGSPPSGT